MGILLNEPEQKIQVSSTLSQVYDLLAYLHHAANHSQQELEQLEDSLEEDAFNDLKWFFREFYYGYWWMVLPLILGESPEVENFLNWIDAMSEEDFLYYALSERTPMDLIQRARRDPSIREIIFENPFYFAKKWVPGEMELFNSPGQFRSRFHRVLRQIWDIDAIQAQIIHNIHERSRALDQILSMIGDNDFYESFRKATLNNFPQVFGIRSVLLTTSQYVGNENPLVVSSNKIACVVGWEARSDGAAIVEKMQRIFQALSNDARLRILKEITIHRAMNKDLSVALEISAPAISQHISILRDAGLITTDREGKRTFQVLSEDLPEMIARLLNEYLNM